MCWVFSLSRTEPRARLRSGLYISGRPARYQKSGHPAYTGTGKGRLKAEKFTDTGSITVRQFRAGAEVCVEASDTAVGMEADFLARVFDPFVQEDAGYRRNFEGSGLAWL
jgi:hypothetical protein